MLTKRVLIVLLILLVSHQRIDADGPELQEAEALNAKVVELYAEGNYSQAISYAERNLEILTTVLGEEHLDVATSMNNLALLYEETGRYAEAEPLYKESLKITTNALGDEHPDVATNMNNLASLYHETSRYDEAELLYRKALEIWIRVLGEEHPDVATSKNNLANLYYETGRYAEAETLYRKALDIRKKVLGEEHPDVAVSMNNLAVLYDETGRYFDSEYLYKQALEIITRTSGEEHPDVATFMNNLAGLYVASGRLMEAENLYEKALKIWTDILGEDHLDVATGMDNLGVLYQQMGRFSDAEPLHERALEIRTGVLGEEHPDVAGSMHNLAGLYRESGRYSEAESLLKRALAIRKKTLGEDHSSSATSMNSLAALYWQTDRYAEAEALYNRALEIRRNVLGEGHPDVATSMSNLAVLYSDMDRYSEAEALYKTVLEIQTNVLSEEHPDFARSMHNLATQYWETGRYTEAEILYKKALEIRTRALGEEHPNVAIGMNNLAMLYAATGEHRASQVHFNKAAQINHKTREDVALVLSEPQKLHYMRQNEYRIHLYLSHTLQYLSSDSAVLIDTFNTWLRWKGAVMESQSRYLEAAYSSEDPQVQKKLEELINTRRILASLQMSRPEKMSFDQYRMRITELEEQKNALEVELNQLSQDFALEKRMGEATVGSLSEILPQDSVYVDFARIETYEFSMRTYGSPQYLAFVLLPSAKPSVRLVDLGAAEAVDRHIRAYLESMEQLGQYLENLGELESPRLQKITTDQEQAVRAISELVLEPLLPFMRGRKKLFLSPDGNLNLMPFEVLPTPEGKVLLEEYRISYVGAGRDIVRFTDLSVAWEAAVLMANPDYDMGLEEVQRKSRELGVEEVRRRAVVSRDAGGLYFNKLPETETETTQIEKLLKERYRLRVKNYRDKEALEEVLYSCSSPRFLHLSTHGYFLPDEVLQERQRKMWGTLDTQTAGDLGIENPMLRSGLAFAGANTALREGSDEGLVSAAEVLGLNLKGTELVVLSACETGRGDVQSGEGVFGLKRSFILSGAKTVVMSLWKIPSEQTVELIGEFYRRMAEGSSKVEALRQARLSIKSRYPRAFYWGALVMVGNPD